MTHTTPNISDLIKDIDSFMDSRLEHKHLKSISAPFSTLSEVPLKIKQKIYENLSHSDSRRISRCFDLLEHLTHHSTPQLLEIISQDKFAEVIPYTISEDELKEVGLNLMKLWTEKFEDRRQELAALFDFIENLDKFDIFLPPVYRQKSEEPLSESNTSESDSSAVTLSSLLEKATTIRDEAKLVMEDLDSDNLPLVYLKPLLAALLESYKQLVMDVFHLAPSQPTGGTSYKLMKILEELDTYETRITEKMEKLQREDGGSDEGNYGDADSESSDNKPEPGESMMTMQEFLTYKTDICLDMSNCPHFNQKETSRQILDKMEVKCPYWHEEEDNRRRVLSDSGEIIYQPSMCMNKDYCYLSGTCGYSHNVFEKQFHPQNYKKKKCSSAKKYCMDGKYCPNYHTLDEKKEWDKILKANFKITSRKGSTEQLYEELDRDDTDQNTNSYLHHESALGLGYSSLESKGALRYVGPSYNSASTYSTALCNPEDVKVVRELKGKLHSKLVIRKDYEDPQKYTDIFMRNSCFNGFPFMFGSVKGIEQNGEVSSLEKQISQ